MKPKHWNRLAAVSRLLYIHNPLYLLSALCVLFGMNRVMAAEAAAVGGPLLMALLGGYTALLAVVAYLIVRFGQVWEDARTILLILVLLAVALSAGFDRLVLDNPWAGGRLLVSGLLFAVMISEGLLWNLRIRLPARYRTPYYLLVVLLFCYPIWLGHLSISGQDAKMPAAVFLFPVAAGIALLTLLPAARNADRGDPPNGTPWRWPAYPWSLFVVLFVATAMRSYSLGMSFESGHGTESSFRLYFLLPLLLAGAVLLLELAITAGNAKAQAIALTMPAGLMLLALPGQGSSQADRFVIRLSETIASPAQLAIYGLIAFYLVAWRRGLRWGECGLIICLALSAIIDRQTFDLESLAAPRWLPLAIIAAIEVGAGAWRRSSGRIIAGMIAAELTVARLPWVSSELPVSPFYAWYGGLLAILLLAAIGNDGWARWIRRFGWSVIPLVTIWGAMTNEIWFPEVPRFVHGAYLAGLVALSALYWYREPARQRLAAAAISLAVFAGVNLRWLYLALEESPLARGLPWLAWGLGSLAVAIYVSLLKAGIVAKFAAAVRSIGNRRLASRRSGPADELKRR